MPEVLTKTKIILVVLTDGDVPPELLRLLSNYEPPSQFVVQVIFKPITNIEWTIRSVVYSAAGHYDYVMIMRDHVLPTEQHLTAVLVDETPLVYGGYPQTPGVLSCGHWCSGPNLLPHPDCFIKEDNQVNSLYQMNADWGSIYFSKIGATLFRYLDKFTTTWVEDLKMRLSPELSFAYHAARAMRTNAIKVIAHPGTMRTFRDMPLPFQMGDSE